jgi:hypothetical protein
MIPSSFWHFLVICQVSLFSAMVSEAAAPAPLATYSESYNELVSDGGKVWACRYEDLAVARLVIDGGVTVHQAEFALPARTLRVAVAPDGVFYAVAYGIGQSGLNRSIHLWERGADGNWTELGEIRGADPYVRTWGAGLLFFGRSVIINLSVEWNLLGPGSVVVSGSPAVPALASLDRDTRLVSFGPGGMMSIQGDGPLYGVRGTISIGELVRSDDGQTWSSLKVPAQPLNDVAFRVSMGGGPFPSHTSGNQLFFWDSDFVAGSAVISVMTDGGGRVRYKIPFAESGYAKATNSTPPGQRFNSPEMIGMFFARSGRCFSGLFKQTSQEGGADRNVLVCSDDYLQSFDFCDYPTQGVVSALANGNAWYFLRRSGVETKLDCMVIPAVEISIVTRPRLNLTSRHETIASGVVWTNFVTGVTTVEAVVRQVIDLSVEPTSNAFTQLETSTNLENWTAVGLPVPTGKTATFVINPDEPRRFYR